MQGRRWGNDTVNPHFWDTHAWQSRLGGHLPSELPRHASQSHPRPSHFTMTPLGSSALHLCYLSPPGSRDLSVLATEVPPFLKRVPHHQSGSNTLWNELHTGCALQIPREMGLLVAELECQPRL